jgi:hypothetical protein
VEKLERKRKATAMLASMKLYGGANDQSSKESWLWWGFLAKRKKGGRGGGGGGGGMLEIQDRW